MIRTSLFLTLFLTVLSSTYGQGQRDRALYSMEYGELKTSGWHFAPGISYCLPFAAESNGIQLADDTMQTINADPFGKVSLYLGLGRHHLLGKDWIDMIDYGLAYKRLSMGEDVTGTITQESTGDIIGTFDEKLAYKRNHAVAYVNFSKWFQIRDFQFISAGLGINADYNIIDNAGDNSGAFASTSSIYPANFWAQVHFKVGYGIKASPRLFILPEIEVPIITAYPTDYGLFSFPALHSDYIPLIFSLKFAFLSKRPQADCVGKPKKKTGHQLWDSKMRRR